MKIALVIPSIRKFTYWPEYQKQLDESGLEYEIFVCGREINDSGIENCRFITREEVMKVGCPISCRDVNLAYGEIWKNNNSIENKEKFDYVFTFDDDTKPVTDNFFLSHMNMLQNHMMSNDYVNPLYGGYPRGFPFYDRKKGEIVLNQGLWAGDGDFFVVDKISSSGSNLSNFGIAPHNKAITISSMNICFKPEIIPAFFQFNEWRFDDIWSGLILKRIADHLGDYISYGLPFVEHNQFPRPLEKDLITERNGFPINENLWKWLQAIELINGTYIGCYKEIAHALRRNKQWKYADEMFRWLRWLRS